MPSERARQWHWETQLPPNSEDSNIQTLYTQTTNEEAISRRRELTAPRGTQVRMEKLGENTLLLRAGCSVSPFTHMVITVPIKAAGTGTMSEYI